MFTQFYVSQVKSEEPYKEIVFVCSFNPNVDDEIAFFEMRIHKDHEKYHTNYETTQLELTKKDVGNLINYLTYLKSIMHNGRK